MKHRQNVSDTDFTDQHGFNLCKSVESVSKKSVVEIHSEEVEVDLACQESRRAFAVAKNCSTALPSDFFRAL